MKRVLHLLIIAAGSQFCAGAANVVQKDPPAIADAYHADTLVNFMGKNVCLSVRNVALRGIDSASIPSPTIRMETQPRGAPESETTYGITIGTFGTISIRESRETNEACTNLPLTRFAWRNEPDGRRANAEFCLPDKEGTFKIHVLASMQANGRAPRQDVKSALVGMAECHMKRFDFSDQETLQLGPYALAYTPQ